MNREVKVIIPNMREFRVFYSDNEGSVMFFKRDWVEVKEEEHWKPSEEQLLKEAVEGRIHAIGFHNAIYIKEPEWTEKLDKYKDGDKIIVIVLPKEDQTNG